MCKQYDYLIVGSGIIGLTIARELSILKKNFKVLIIEKEKKIGFHASGRNSGVLHSGVYYPRGSLKAKVCSKGARLMSEYCIKNNLPIKKIGKVIVPVKKNDNKTIEKLIKNAEEANLNHQVIDKKQLKK